MTEFKPAFLIGVTGHMDLDPKNIEQLEQRVARLLRFLKRRPFVPGAKWSTQERQKYEQDYQNQQDNELKALVDDLLPSNPKDPNDVEKSREECFEALSHWDGLPNTPVVVFSSLAPGADTLVARVALTLQAEWKAANLEDGFSVMAPQAFPYDLYPDSTTFNWKDSDGTTNPQTPENIRRRDDYRELVKAIGGESNTFPVWLQRDLKAEVKPGRISQAFHESCESDLRNSDPAPRHERYRAAGEYNAAYPHLLIAIWDQDHDSDKEAGTAAIVEARRRGMKPHLLPITHPLGLAPGGPIAHLTTTRLKKKNNPSMPMVAPVPPIRWLDPYIVNEPAQVGGHGRHDLPDETKLEDAKPSLLADTQKRSALQFKSFKLTCRIAANLSRFNALPVPSEEEVNNELDKRLTRQVRNSADHVNGTSAARLEALTCRLYENHREFYDALRRVAGLRRRAANMNRRFDHAIQSTLKWLFRLTIMAVATLHLFSHWEPQNASHHPRSTLTALWRASEAPSEPAFGDVTLLTHGEEASKSSEDRVVEAQGTGPADAIVPQNSQSSDAKAPFEVTKEKRDKSLSQMEIESDTGPEAKGHENMERSSEWIHFAWGVLALSFAVLAYVLYWRYKPHLKDVQAHDCRALAEGLRVQFYWSLMGLGESVSSNYMQRQRSELDWIRGAIRWASFPYEEWRVRFDNLSRDLQIELLECVQYSWIRDQANYFQKRTREHNHQLHYWHKLGRTFGFAGFLVFFVLVIGTFPWSTDFLSKTPSEFKALLSLGIAAVMIVLVCWRWKKPVPDAKPKAATLTDPPAASALNFGKWIGEGWWNFSECCLEQFVQTKDVHASHVMRHKEHSRWMLRNFKAYIFLSVTLAAIVLATSAVLGLFPWLPSSLNWAIIFAGWCLLLGAMSVAWAEKLLFSEFAYQFSTMAALFRSADLRLDTLLERLRNSQKCEPKLLAESMQQPGKPDQFAQDLSEARELLAALGKEALDENAEWLILHRARPLEPLMAG